MMAHSQSSPYPHEHHVMDTSSSDSIHSARSGGTVRHHRVRSLSNSSLSSLTSLWIPPFRRQESNLDSTRSASSSNLTLGLVPTRSDGRSVSRSYPRRASLTSMLSSRLRTDSMHGGDGTEGRLLDVAESEGEAGEESEDEDLFYEPEIRIAEGTQLPCLVAELEDSSVPTGDGAAQEATGVRRWLSTLRRRKRQNQAHSQPSSPSKPLSPWNRADHLRPSNSSPARARMSQHKPSDSQGSSMMFVTAMKSATATIASFSIATISRRDTKWRRGHQRSSLISGSDPRPSIDSQRSIADEAARQRSRKRRAKLEELVRSEEGYLADIKALSKAYTTILSPQPSTFYFARSIALRNIAQIAALHDDILGILHKILPFSEYDRPTANASPRSSLIKAHTRWHSVDVPPTRSPPNPRKLAIIRQSRRSLNISRSSADESRALGCTPQIVALVAKAFSAVIDRISVYEEYGANYELVQRDIDETQQAMVGWQDFDRAIEVLAAHVNPVKSRESNRKKALTIKDLLIKPIQRLPRYELIFSDLCKLTPVCDDPEANAVLQDLLVQLNEACHRMNSAKEINPFRARMLETTCLLGDRLTFSNQVPRSVFLQLLGQVHLCGCLYIAYRSHDRIKGLYAICVLFESTLLLATADDDTGKYSTIAGLPLAKATVVEADNGKGLQCYTAPYAWKVVFEHSARMFEVIVVACSAVEADAWRQRIKERIESQAKAVLEGAANVFELHSPLISEMRSVGKAFGKPGSFVRRMSVHRTATVGPTTDLNQVIIKNTQSAKEAMDNSSNTSLQIPRSQSVATPSHVQTLAPRRADRVRLEALLSAVWTKDLLPYPGMTPRRSDPIRASANHVIRKFSMASITSNFSSKRSASYTSMGAQHRKEDMPPPRPRTSGRDYRTGSSKTSTVPLVDFHTAPEAFLPADFGLHDANAKRKKSALRTLTMTMERPFSPLLGTESKQSSLRRAQSVRDMASDRPNLAPPTKAEKPKTPVYSVVQERPKTPAQKLPVPPSQTKAEAGRTPEVPAKTPRKSKSRLLRLFGS